MRLPRIWSQARGSRWPFHHAQAGARSGPGIVADNCSYGIDAASGTTGGVPDSTKPRSSAGRRRGAGSQEPLSAPATGSRLPQFRLSAGHSTRGSTIGANAAQARAVRVCTASTSTRTCSGSMSGACHGPVEYMAGALAVAGQHGAHCWIARASHRARPGPGCPATRLAAGAATGLDSSTSQSTPMASATVRNASRCAALPCRTGSAGVRSGYRHAEVRGDAGQVGQGEFAYIAGLNTPHQVSNTAAPARRRRAAPRGRRSPHRCHGQQFVQVAGSFNAIALIRANPCCRCPRHVAGQRPGLPENPISGTCRPFRGSPDCVHHVAQVGSMSGTRVFPHRPRCARGGGFRASPSDEYSSRPSVGDGQDV